MADPKDQPAAVSVLQEFAAVVADAIEWLAELIGDDTARELVLSDLGLDPVAGATVDEEQLLQQLSGDITAVRSYAAANLDQADIAALASAIEAATNLVDACAGILETATSNMPADRGAVEVVAALLQMFVVDAVRDSKPALYAVLRAIQVFTDEALLVDWGKVGDFLGDFSDSVALQDEHDAVMFSPYLMLIAAGWGLLIDKTVADLVDEDIAYSFVYGWDPDPTLPADLLPAERIAERTLTMFFGDQLDDHAQVSIAAVPAEHGGPGLLTALGGRLVVESAEDAESPGVQLALGGGSAAAAFLPFPGATRDAQTFGPEALALSVSVTGQETRRIVGSADGTRIEIGQVVSSFAVLDDRAVMRWGVKDAALIIDLSTSDGFLRDLISAREIRIPFSIVLGVDTSHGFFVEGGTGLAATIPVNQSLAGLRLDTLALSLQFPDRQSFRLDVTAVAGLDLGMFQASVDQIGFGLNIDFSGGNLAIADVEAEFRPPKGIGLTLGFERARGGGYLYLDPDKGEYAGVLQIDFGKTGLKALGILTTKGLPNDNWALLLILFATATPPVGAAGWVLTGVGGVIGVNHSVSEQAFRDGLRTKALDDVLFPKDPVANAARILGTLRTLFPVAGDKALFGIAAEFSYLASRRVTIRAGLILQLGPSGPERVVILGQLKISAPQEDSGLISLNADLFGLIEWGEHQVRIAVDSRLFDSKIGSKGAKFTITGSLSVRVTLGSGSVVAFTAGGFHPDYAVPANLNLPAKLDRFGFNLKKGIARMTLAGYLALTPCTLQFGVQLDLVAKKYGFSVEVRMGLHVLLDQENGRFTTDIELLAALKKGATALMKVELKFALSGPGRWRAVGSAKFKLFFFSKTISFDECWGNEEEAALPLIDAVAGLVAELSTPANWGGVPTSGALVALRNLAGRNDDTAVVHPLSDLSVEQRLLPLGVQLDRIGGNRITGPSRLDIEAVTVGQDRTETLEPVKNDFARGQFVDMRDEEALALPSFEPMRSGVVVSPAGIRGGSPRQQTVEYETIYPIADDEPPSKDPYVFPFAQAVLSAQLGAVARSTKPVAGSSLYALELPKLRVRVRDRSYVIADADTMLTTAGTGGLPLHEALDVLAVAHAKGDTRLVLAESHEVAP